MFRKTPFILPIALLTILTGLNFPVFAQRPYRVSDRQVETLLNRIETRADSFRQNLDTALDRSSFNGTQRENEINQYVSDFEVATNRLLERFRNRQDVSADVEEVLNRGWSIDYFMRNNRLPAAERDWNYVRTDLRTLADYSNLTWRWDNRTTTPPYYGNRTNDNRDRSDWNNSNRDRTDRNDGYRGRGNFRERLTGTYTLDASRSDNATTVADRAVRTLSATDSDRVRRSLERRLTAPETIALEQAGRQFEMASSTSPQVSFNANGVTQTETRPNGRTVRTTATLRGNQLVISSLGDRGSDFTVTFEPLGNGDAMRVTREVFIERLNQPVIARSVYTKTSETAQMTIFEGNRNRDRNIDRNNDRSGNNDERFNMPRGAVFSAVLNNDLTTKQSRVGDRFTMTVNSPNQFEGATIEGYVAKVNRADRFTGKAEMALEFERIRMRDGQTFNFVGYIEDIRTPNGDRVAYDNEGVVKEDDSQTQRTVRNTGIGAAVGAILGGILGGGQGAAVGAVLGGGAGVGSVVLQGRDDLNLVSGTEFKISAATRNNVSPR